MSDYTYRTPAPPATRLSRSRDRGLSLVLSLVAVGAIGASSTGANASAHPHARHHAAHHRAHHHAGIPQRNRGDHDPDNNGAPSDGDGNV